MRKVPLIVALAILLPALAVAGMWLTGKSSTPAQADPGVTTLAIDMIIDDDADTTPDNTDVALGPIDTCLQVGSGASGTFDVVFDQIEAGKDLKGYQYFMGFNAANITFTAQSSPSGCPAGGGDGLQMICSAANSCTGMLGCLDTGEGVPEPPDSGSPASPGVHDVFHADSTGGVTVAGPQQGVLARYTVQCGADGTYSFGLDDSVTYATVLNNAAASPIWDRPGDGVDNDGDTAIDEDLMLDNTATPVHGIIACGVDCPLPMDVKKLDLSVVYGEDWSGLGPASCVDTADNGGDTVADAADPDCMLLGGTALVSVPAQFQLSETVHNNGPGTGVAKITTTCTGPAPGPYGLGGLCSYHVRGDESPDGDLEVIVDGGPPVVNPAPSTVFSGATITVIQRVFLPVSGDATILLKDWDLHCLEPSTHTWTFDNRIDPDSPLNPDETPGNNEASTSIVADCLAFADLKINSMTIAMDPIDNDGDTAVDEDGPGDANDDGMEDGSGPVAPGNGDCDDGLDNDADTAIDDADADCQFPITDDDFDFHEDEDWVDLFEADDGYDDDADTAIDEDGKGDCDGDGDPDDDGDTVVDEDGGDCPIIRVQKSIHNNGPWGPTATNINKVVVGFTALGPPYVSPCVFTALPGDPPQADLDVSGDATIHDEAFVMDCPKLGFEVDDDGDRVESGTPRFSGTCSDGIDNDADTLTDLLDDDCNINIDEDIPDGLDNDGDTFVDEDGPVSIVAAVAFDLLVPKDEHILDTDLGLPGCDPYDPATWVLCGDNGAMAQVILNDILPDQPVFSAIVDEANPSSPILHPGPPAFDGDCLTTLPCKRQFDLSLAGGKPLYASIYSQPSALTITPSLLIPNGEDVGIATAVTHLAFLGGPCVNPFPVSIILEDCAVAVADGEGPDDVPDATTCLSSTGCWSTKLDSIRNTFFSGAPLIARKCAGTDVAGTWVDVNVLVFPDGAGGTLEFLQILDPDLDQDGIYDAVDPDDDGDTIPDALDPDADNNGTKNMLETITDQCTPYTAKLLEFGSSSPGGVTLATCDTEGAHLLDAILTREDIGTKTMKFAPFTCPTLNVSVSKTDDLAPTAPVGLATTHTVTITTTGPPDVVLTRSIIGPVACHPRWVDDPDPMIVGGNQVSVVTETVGAGVFLRDYEVYCDEAGEYDLQIVVNVDSATVPLATDPNPEDNQDENHPHLTCAGDDVDGDGVVNWEDNCPYDVNPDQTDTDGDGVGDVCDDDDDDDGIADVDDECPLAAEDYDGVDDADGCPETDASISVEKDDSIEVVVSENHRETVTATACNGNYGLTDLRFNELLKSELDGCEARWVCLPGDDCVEDVDDEDGDTVPETLISQLELVVEGVAPYNCVEKVREYEVHCPDKCFHDDAIFIEESVVPEYPVKDPDVSNNVIKQYIDITAWAEADIKVLSVEVESAPDELRLAEDTDGDSIVDIFAIGDFVVKKVLHNNGPYSPAHVALEYDAILPPDCRVLDVSAPATLDLPASETVSIFEYWLIECDEASDHEFTFGNCVTPEEEHVRDPDPDNNCGSASVSRPVIGTTDLELDVVVNSVSDMDVSENVLFTVDKTLANVGPFAVTPDVVQVMSGEDDCELSFHVTNLLLGQTDDLEISCDGVVIDPPTPAGWEGSDTVWCGKGETISIAYQVPLAAHGSVALVEEFDKHCQDICDHYFALDTDVTRDAAKDPHVEFAPVADSQTWMEEVWAEVDLKVVDWFFLDLPEIAADVYKVLVPPSSIAYGHQKEVIHNNGPFGPVDLFKTISATPGDGCTVDYECKGGEMIMLNDWIVIWDCPAGYDTLGMYPVEYGDHMDVQFFIEDLDVSVDYWQSELWSFHIDEHVWQCAVDFEKELTVVPPHAVDQNGAYDAKSVVVCADTDSDGVPDDCLGEHDNCVLVPNPDQTDTDGDGLGDACDSRPEHDVDVKYCLKFGPAPVNISDAQGKYMWTICEIGNASNHTELVDIDLKVVAGDCFLGCVMTQELILPGQTSFLMTSGEQKFVLWRNRFECHDPAVPDVCTLTIEACIDSDHTDCYDDDGDTVCDEDPVDGVDNDGDSLIDEDPPEGDGDEDCHEQDRNIIIHMP